MIVSNKGKRFKLLFDSSRCWEICFFPGVRGWMGVVPCQSALGARACRDFNHLNLIKNNKLKWIAFSMSSLMPPQKSLFKIVMQPVFFFSFRVLSLHLPQFSANFPALYTEAKLHLHSLRRAQQKAPFPLAASLAFGKVKKHAVGCELQNVITSVFTFPCQPNQSNENYPTKRTFLD